MCFEELVRADNRTLDALSGRKIHVETASTQESGKDDHLCQVGEQGETYAGGPYQSIRALANDDQAQPDKVWSLSG
jgi:hypothetical protein